MDNVTVTMSIDSNLVARRLLMKEVDRLMGLANVLGASHQERGESYGKHIDQAWLALKELEAASWTK